MTLTRLATVLTAVLAAVALPGPPAPAALARPARQEVEKGLLTCAVSTLSGEPLTFEPPLSQIQRTITMRGRLALTGCTARDRALRHVRSGMFAFSGSSRATCTGAQAVRGEGTVTWYGPDGRSTGRSTLRPGLDRVTTYNPGDALLAGTVVRGLMTGARVSGSATPTSDVSGCVLGGLRSIQGRGTVTFLR